MGAPFASLEKSKDFLIAIDSDGCVFDTMEVKHKECFCPVTIRHYGLQAVSKFVRDSWEFVNLYSVDRGMNRFPALVRVIDQLRTRPEVLRRGVTIPVLEELRDWIHTKPKLGNPALADAAERIPALVDALAWSEAVNQAVTEMVHGVPPFPYVHDVLSKATNQADMMVASSTPVDALHREWGEHGLSEYVQVIAGQEMGSKSHQLSTLAGSQYASDHMLMIGDAFSDYRAAKSVEACFYPVLPGEEESSWERLQHEALDRFFACEYQGSYEQGLISELRERLPEHPPWERKA
ncbi:MAG: HAD hydrolase-like protein [Rhodothermaceae bacterium]|nr:HAD hydrolase-like protein [Rhodothermaceae bacterium]MXZ57575.1 HAD hydrolase-like protein [Rhodothermaceae bacterium]MYB91234.1 HAD hydrolase-like protein [Rhodothermaceae bacterium]MYD68134.1 HAD hydrolase-like protein [Rhodothermaceae bacterium]MYG45330.1 HAD hydrolase-like protein [Rhodothermaceae bacterium]